LYLSIYYLIGVNSMQPGMCTSRQMPYSPASELCRLMAPTWAPLRTAVRHVSGFSKYLNTSGAIVDEHWLDRLKALHRDLIATNGRCWICPWCWCRRFNSASPSRKILLWPRSTRTSRSRCSLEVAPSFDPNVSPRLDTLLFES
jgi:hypothetical protein